MNSSHAGGSIAEVEPLSPTPMTRLLSSRSLLTSGVKSESPDTITKVDTKSRVNASSMASTAIWMSAAFLRTESERCGISISSTLASTMPAAVVAEQVPVRVGRRVISRPRSASASSRGLGSKR
jgi:hypothetical protein